MYSDSPTTRFERRHIPQKLTQLGTPALRSFFNLINFWSWYLNAVIKVLLKLGQFSPKFAVRLISPSVRACPSNIRARLLKLELCSDSEHVKRLQPSQCYMLSASDLCERNFFSFNSHIAINSIMQTRSCLWRWCKIQKSKIVHNMSEK